MGSEQPPEPLGTLSSRQLQVFHILYDSKTATLRLPLHEEEARRALLEMNNTVSTTLARISVARKFNVAFTICQGACLMAAALERLGVMRSAWTGPECDLANWTGKVMIGLQGSKKVKVRVDGAGCLLAVGR